MRAITSFHQLRFNSLLNADSSGRKADILEALIIQASNEYIKVMKDIGYNDESALRKDLAHDIEHNDKWKKNQLKNRYRSI
jgi:hypothetical protein|tara:strand:+ start:792 stop:1034 length:243 start_codon:yes stop_codon:yes gene_type:complete